MVVMGIDPGSQTTGFAVLDCAGSLKIMTAGVLALPKEEFLARISVLGRDFQALLGRHRPGHVAIEKVFLGKNADSAFKLGHARGILIFQALASGAQLFEYSTREVKKTVTGSGGADKEQVRRALEVVFRMNLSGLALDASDALALAFHHACVLNNRGYLKQVEAL